MAIMLRRQLDESEKARVLQIHGRRCFATGHEIPEGDPIHFDHIKAFTQGGVSELDNIAPMCETHNKQKGVLPLGDFRVKLRLEEFFSKGDSLTLKDLLCYFQDQGDIHSYGQHVVVHHHDDKVHIDTPSGKTTYTLYRCPTTGWHYFYATLPVTLIDSDDDEDQKIGLQPRFLIFDKVFGLYRHFQQHPVLQPSIGRVYQQRILLFDGQHKIAALLWNKRREFECKIYLDPNLRLLNETNIAAHDKFAQTRFYSSVMVLKLGTEFGTDFTEYKNLEDGAPKTEYGFMKYLESGPYQSLTRAERNSRFRSWLYNSILQDEGNLAAKFVSTGNRSSDEKPLTIDMLSKSLFACFLHTEPIDDNMATDSYQRDKEVANNITLMNMLFDLGLYSWDAKAGKNDDNQRKLNRIFRSKAVMAWSELLRDAVCGKLDLQDAEDRARPFYRDLSVADTERVKNIVERLMGWKFWNSPPDSEIDRILADNKSAVKDWLRRNGMTTGYLMGAPE